MNNSKKNDAFTQEYEKTYKKSKDLCMSDYENCDPKIRYKIIELAHSCFDEEKNRCRNTEHKAIIHIGMTSIVITVVSTFITLLLDTQITNNIGLAWIIIFGSLLILLGGCTLFSLFSSLRVISIVPQRFLNPFGIDIERIPVYPFNDENKYLYASLSDVLENYYIQLIITEYKIHWLNLSQNSFKVGICVLTILFAVVAISFYDSFLPICCSIMIIIIVAMLLYTVLSRFSTVKKGPYTTSK